MKNSFGLTTLRKAQKVFPGLMMCVVVALAAKLICEHFGAPVMLMALLIGMAFNFLTEDYGKCLAGIEFSAKALLRKGTVFLGLGITLQQIAATGHEVLYINVGGVVLTIVCSLGLSRVRFGLLTGGAVATCGAPAALAISSVLQKKQNTGTGYGFHRHRCDSVQHNGGDHLPDQCRLCWTVGNRDGRVP